MKIAFNSESGSIRRSQVIVLAVAAICIFVSFACKARKLEPGDIMKKAIEKTGCSKTWQTRIEEGTFIAWNTPGWGTLRARYERVVKKPDKIKIDQDYSAYDHPFFRTFYYFSGDAWVVTNLVPRRSERTKTMLEDFLKKLDWLSYYLENSEKIFSMKAPSGDSLIAGRGVYRICCATTQDSTIFDIEKDSFLPLRQIETHAKRQLIFHDYRKVQGRRIPYRTVIFENDKKTQEIIWDKVEFDKVVSDSLFLENRPSN